VIPIKGIESLMAVASGPSFTIIYFYKKDSSLLIWAAITGYPSFFIC